MFLLIPYSARHVTFVAPETCANASSYAIVLPSLPRYASDTSLVLQVIAVGSGKENEKGEVVAPNLKAGDMVLYSKYSGTEFTGSNDTQYIVVRESDILASVA
jgi:chaperonin GroES